MVIKDRAINQWLAFAAICLSAVCLQGCASLSEYKPLPRSLEDKVEMPGFTHVRSWSDKPSKYLEASARESIPQELAANHGTLPPVASFLVLSGGGSDGAFGAGFLCGWTKTGTRPEFKLVTGISTGALIAPFAFLGSAYDAQLKRVYTTMSDEKIYKPNSMFSIFLGVLSLQSIPSMATNEPLAKIIEKEVDAKLLRAIAIQHQRGRRLLVGTTQFNAQRLVIWNMGEIAKVGTPQALALFRKVLLASAAIPVTFPPQYFTVKAEGKIYEEMHVDGGVEAQLMLYENAIYPLSSPTAMKSVLNRTRRLYIIRNERIYPTWENVRPQLKYIALRSIETLTKSQGIGDLFRLYVYSMRDNIAYNLAFIPDTFTAEAKTPFDNSYMRKVFALGYDLGSSGQGWSHYPPDYEAG